MPDTAPAVVDPAAAAPVADPAAPAPVEPEVPQDMSVSQFLEGELAQDATLQRFKTVPDLANSYLESRRMLGNAIIKPGENASDEDVAKYRTALGVPNTAAEYGLKHDAFENVPLDEGMVTKFMEIGHANNFSPDQMNAVFQFYGSSLDERAKADVETINAEHAEVMAGLQKEWGAKFDENKAAIGAVSTKLFSEKTMQLFEDTRVGDSPEFMQDILKIAQSMGEDSIFGTTKGPAIAADTPMTLKQSAKDLQNSADYWKNEVKQAKVREIFEQISKLQGKS